MKHISLILVLIFGCTLNFYSQENNDIRLIKGFYKALYITDIAPEGIVSKYLKYSDTIQYKKGISMVMDFRSLADKENGNFFLLKKDIVENNLFISSYNSFSAIDKAKFNNLEKKKREKVYLKSAIPQYILIEKDKISSFFGFQKAGSNDHLFIVF